jgi:alkylated DNA nucleotide flippase Atl1
MMATVDGIGVKDVPGSPMRSASSVRFLEGKGIAGDVSANAGSPRQVLVVRAEDRSQFKLPRGYLRENISISGFAPEEVAPGRVLEFASGAKLFLVFNCEPCKTISGLVPNLKEITGRRGVLGIVLNNGSVSSHEDCQSFSTTDLDRLSDKPSERVFAIIRRIPAGRVIDYATLLVAAGLQGPYFRVMPKYLSQALLVGIPAHRVVDSSFRVPVATVAGHALLEQELAPSGAFFRSNQQQLFQGSASSYSVPRTAGWHPLALDLVRAEHGN